MIYIDGYLIDIAVSESPVFSADSTDHPTEQGSLFSDHVIDKPTELGLECIVSDTPLSDVAAVRQAAGNLSGEDAIPSREAHEFLQALVKEHRPVIVECESGTYRNMLLINLSPKFDKSTTGGYYFTANFKELTIIELRRITVRVAVPIAGPKKDKGPKSPKPANGVPRRVIQMGPGQGIWFDPDIGEWRYLATMKADGSWEFFKGQPLGVMEKHKTDAEYRAIIQDRDRQPSFAPADPNNPNGPVVQDPNGPQFDFTSDPAKLDEVQRQIDAGNVIDPNSTVGSRIVPIDFNSGTEVVHIPGQGGF